MSQRFVIDINVNGVGGSGRGGSGRGGNDGALAAGTIGAAALFRNEGPYPGSLSPRSKDGNDYAVPYKKGSWMSRADYEAAGLEDSGYGGYGGKLISFGTRRIVGGHGILTSGGLQEQETLFGFGVRKIGDFYAENQRKIKATGVAAAWKVANASIDRAKYTSGDSYQNRQLDIGMKLVGYGAALAMSGAAAPLVAVGIIGNEIINVISDSAQYNYNLKLERQQITNMKAVAGNISYGRDRGGI